MAAFLMGGMAMAQHARHSDKMPEPKVRAERMTERMVKEYSLNDTQKQQLLEANLALVEKMGDMPMHRAKAHKHHKRDGKRHQLTDEQRAQKKAEILAKVGILLGYQTANTELRTQLDAMKLAGVTQMVDDAVKAGKFNADKKDHFINLGKTIGAESLKLTLDSMAAVTKPMQLINPSGGATGGGMATGQWNKLSEVPEGQLKLMRENEPDKYRALYKAEYGIECPKFN